jgi:uncharacterized membrane protein
MVKKISGIYPLLMINLLFTCSLLIGRVWYSGKPTYLFLVWNLFLAFIPLVASELIHHTKSRAVAWLLFTCWLLFLPNAPYIVSDLLHLKQRADVPMWFDVLLLFSAAFNGLILGLFSILNMDFFLQVFVSSKWRKAIIATSLVLAAFGIYLGRFLRFNSWDVLADPLPLLADIADRFINPLSHQRTWAFTILFGMFMNVVYWLTKQLINNNHQGQKTLGLTNK